MIDPRVLDLLQRWEDQRDLGQPLTAAQLCHDCPDLLDPLQQALTALDNLSPFVDAEKCEAPTALPSLPDYEFLETLGHGGMGMVYKARQESLGRLVAVKMILTGPYATQQERQRFRREAEAVARLQHPNIVQIFEVGEHQGQSYLVLEYVAGDSLARRLAASPLPPRDAAVLLAILARAIQYAHDRGLVHRDLKPGNILLSQVQSWKVQSSKLSQASMNFELSNFELGTPKITDFGLVKELDAATEQQTQSGAILGTPGYMAPEQAAGQTQQIGPATDIYALGTVLYEALTGRPPFKAASTFETLEQVRYAEPVPPRRLQPKVPRDLETICLTCLRKEPGKRYSSAGALADDLECFIRGEPIQARPVGITERLWKWARRRPAVAGLLAALALVIVAGLTATTSLWLQAASARVTVEHERDNARSEKARADDRYQEACAAMDRMLARLEEHRFQATPRLKELYEAQLEEAIPFYERVLHEGAPLDPSVQRSAAHAFERAGVLQRNLSLPTKARRSLERATRLWEDLVARFPDSLDDQAHLALCYTGLAVDGGEEWERKALAIRERLCRLRPEKVEWQESLAETYHHLGQGRLNAHTPRDAAAFFEKALAILTTLNQRDPRAERPRSQGANDCSALALCYVQNGEPDKAEATFRQGENWLKPLVAEAPAERERALLLASLYTNWAILKREYQHQPDSAARLAGEAVALAERLLRQEPRYHDARRLALSAHGERANALDAWGHYADAIHDWDRVIELSEPTLRPRMHLLRAQTLLHAGDHAQAAAEAAQVARNAQDPNDLYNAAGTLSDCVPVAHADVRLSPAARERLAGHYAERAVAVLQHALARGSNDVAKAPVDPVFAPLRHRKDFQTLLTMLGQQHAQHKQVSASGGPRLVQP